MSEPTPNDVDVFAVITGAIGKVRPIGSHTGEGLFVRWADYADLQRRLAAAPPARDEDGERSIQWLQGEISRLTMELHHKVCGNPNSGVTSTSLALEQSQSGAARASEGGQP